MPSDFFVCELFEPRDKREAEAHRLTLIREFQRAFPGKTITVTMKESKKNESR